MPANKMESQNPTAAQMRECLEEISPEARAEIEALCAVLRHNLEAKRGRPAHLGPNGALEVIGALMVRRLL